MKEAKGKVLLFCITIVVVIAVIIATYILTCKIKNETTITDSIAKLEQNDSALAGVILNTNGYNHYLNGWLGNFVVGGTYSDGYCMYLGKGAPSNVSNRGSAYNWFQGASYNKLKWLFDNMIVIFQPINDNVYGNDLSNEIIMYKKNMNLLINKYGYKGNIDSLTDKQIFEVQQCILWNFINGTDFRYKLSGNQLVMYDALIKGMNDNTNYISDGTDIVTVTKEGSFGLSSDGKIGPFKLNNSKGKINKIVVENFSGIDGGFSIIDVNGNKIEEYNKYNGIFYIKLNKMLTNGTKYDIKGNVSVKSYKTLVTEWWDGNNSNQPVTTFARDPEKSTLPFNSNYFSGYIDLALKKQITQINGINVNSNVRSLDINSTGLLNNTSNDAIYNMRKNPIDVEVGDVVKYKISIFNESKDLDGYAKEITDYIPEGLKFDISSNINADNNWKLYKSNGLEVKWSKDATMRLIARLYKEVLKRSQTEEQLFADEVGITHYNSYSEGKITIETMIANIINSTEGVQKTNSLSDTQFIKLMYNVILENNPSSEVLDTKSKFLNGDKAKRQQLVKDILNSTEFRKVKYAKLPDSELEQVTYITTDKLSNEKIAKLTDELSLQNNSKDVEVEFIIKEDAEGILTNIAEITRYGYMNGNTFIEANKENIDRDSIQGNITLPSNKTDLEEYFGKDGKQKDEPNNYPGQQDDDDFEKVRIDKKVDLALKKSIINIEETTYNRLGKIDVLPLKNGDTTANYHMDKSTLFANQGNIVTYRIYIFNEGSVDVTASEIKDYIPDELEFLPDDELNKKYKWEVETNSDNKVTTLTTKYLQGKFIDSYSRKMKEERS